MLTIILQADKGVLITAPKNHGLKIPEIPKRFSPSKLFSTFLKAQMDWFVDYSAVQNTIGDPWRFAEISARINRAEINGKTIIFEGELKNDGECYKEIRAFKKKHGILPNILKETGDILILGSAPSRR